MKNAASKVYLICGGLFTVIGLIFVPCAIVMATHMDALTAHGRGNVTVLPFSFGLTGGVMLIVGTALFVRYLRSNKKCNERLNAETM